MIDPQYVLELEGAARKVVEQWDIDLTDESNTVDAAIEELAKVLERNPSRVQEEVPAEPTHRVSLVGEQDAPTGEAR